MVKVIVSPGRRVWDAQNHREAAEGEVIELKDVEAKILKFRGLVSDGPGEEKPQEPPPAPPPVPPPPAPPPEPHPVATTAEAPVITTETAETLVDPNGDEQARRRTSYRRRDMQPER